MVDKICNKIMKRIRAKMPEVDDERAEVMQYGLELLVGEFPKTFILLLIAYILGIFKLYIISFFIILPYRIFSGGVHLKSHLGCILGTTAFYCGNVYLSKFINFPSFSTKLIFTIIVYLFAIIMITLYAPADTQNVPILRKKDRKIKKIGSYVSVTILIIASLFIKNTMISNMLIIGVLLQTIMISRFTYNIFKMKFGYLEYIKKEKNAI